MKTFEVMNGMPASVFRDKYARRKDDGSYETWTDVAERMVAGNMALAPRHRMDGPVQEHAQVYADQEREFVRLARAGVIPMSGRHLQHGDLSQPDKVGDLFANCTSAMFCWASFLLLMKGAGVGRDYSSGVCWVDWDHLPDCRFVLDAPDNMGRGGHPDYEPWIETLADARHKYDADSEKVRWFGVEDSAEGWAKVVMIMETAAFHKRNRDTVFVFDFSKVRKAGSPLMGQQGRPASGPVPFIRALHQVMTVKNAGFKPWKQALFIDHFLAACVVVGGVRRSARLASKYWRDRDVIEFIDIKRGGFLWSANNSIAVDKEFWEQARSPKPSHGRRVFEAAVGASYYDDTGEPGFFNVDLINDYQTDIDSVTAQNYISDEYKRRLGDIHPKTFEMIDYMLFKAKHHVYRYVLNPCGEICLAIWGANCYVGDICLANAENTDDAVTAARCVAEALVRVNTMPCLYQAEVRRTNRIGVSLTGLHEFMWNEFALGFRDAIGDRRPDGTFVLTHPQARNFWAFVVLLSMEVQIAAAEEAFRCGLRAPATSTTVKPSGTVAKVMNCTEGVHLPATRHYVRWVMRTVAEAQEFARQGYPVKDVSAQYANTWVVGFPTCLPFVDRIDEEALVTAPEASPDEQYRWLMLLEEHWLGGDRRNNQVSYCLEAGHLVITDKGMYRIEDVSGGNVPSRDGTLQRVMDTVDNSVQSVIRVRLSTGAELSGTPAHRVLIVDQAGDFVWKSLGDIRAGDMVVRRLGDNIWSDTDCALVPIDVAADGRRTGGGLLNAVNLPDMASEDFGEFVGMLMSDGSMHINGISLTAADFVVVERFEELVAKLFHLNTTRKVDSRGGAAIGVGANSRVLVRWLLKNGVPRYHDDNRIPDFILRSRKPVIEAFLRGYTLDGWHNAICSTVSKRMAHDIAAVLWNLGYRASVGWAKGRNYWFSASNNGIGKDQWRVYLPRREDRVAFVRDVGYAESRKNDEVMRECAGYVTPANRHHAIPAKPFIDYFLENRGDFEWSSQLQELANSRETRQVVSIGVVEQFFAGKMPGVEKYLDPHMAFSPVVEVTAMKEKVPTFDISVENSHEYVANGIVVHNTLKWRKSKIPFERYMAMVLENQPTVRCCSLMPELEQDASAYAYLPEEPVSKERYDELVSLIRDVSAAQPYDKDRLTCEGGACPIEPDLRQDEVAS